MAEPRLEVLEEMNAKQYAEYSQRLKQFHPELRKQMRKDINQAVREIVKAQREKITSVDTVGGKGGSTSNQAAADRVAYSLRNAKQNVSILTEAYRFNRAITGSSGLRQSVAKSLRVVNKDTGFNYGVRVSSESGRMPPNQRTLPRAMNKGFWKHPVYGRWTGATQQVSPPDWFSGPVNEGMAGVYEAVRHAVNKAVIQTH